jgi:GT2 family glycosyltransferase
MVTGKILLMDKKTIYSTDLFPARSRRATERGRGEKDVGQYEKTEYIFGPTGAISFFKREMLEDVRIRDEYFDEIYPWGYDDLDLCWRGHLFGWNGFYTPKAIGYHIKGGTIKTEKPKLKFLKKYYFTQLPRWAKVNLMRGRYATMIKNDSLKDILVNLPYILLFEFKLWSYILLIEPELISGIMKEIKFIKRNLEKRKIIQKKKLAKIGWKVF